MAIINNKWVGYLDRSFQQVKDSLISKVTISNPEVTDHSESNILIVIISMFSGITEMLNYYIDNMAREAFIGTARKFSSMVQLVKLLDYRIKAANPSSVDVTFSFVPALTGNGTIPANTIIKTSNNVQFVTTELLALLSGDVAGTVGAKQITQLVGISLGTTNGLASQKFSLGLNYVDNSSAVYVDAILYLRVDTLGLSGPTDKHYIVEIDVDGIAYVVFGNGTFGIIPPVSKPVTADYQETLGVSGNVDQNTITTIVSVLSLPGVSTITVNNPISSSGGSGYEDVERIRTNAPLSIRTLDRAVTFQDYIDITRLATGVEKATVQFNCGKTVEIYIAPTGGGIAQSPLLASTYNFVALRKMITTFINVQPAGETELVIVMDVTSKYRVDPLLAQADIVAALVGYGDITNQDINKKVRTSDIIALVDNLDKVEFLDLALLTTRPYARPTNHITQLLWNRETLVTCTIKSTWRLEYTGGVTFNLVRNNTFEGTINIGSTFTDVDNNITFTIQPSTYTIGEEWTFTTYPANKSIELDDFTLPKVTASNITLNIVEQLTPLT